MFKKLGKALGTGGSKGTKYRFEVVVAYVDGLPSSVRRCRVQWSRNSKVQATDDKLVTSGELAGGAGLQVLCVAMRVCA